ncbi:MAG: hypothetical protein JO171_19900 [Paludibacterium sp.]|uniref:hypothetical protein n=1 Tax=Paludibacterium sp. TaxID=1917523 RepID=UPI0025CCB1B6|nr:hypothetical protein [Paludibacterium sp.]MBV8049417.1 hypothetical protein [Paludibacterium sp.]MBV8645794.1 hypothetical protein [Paludibacterium sp.]
MHLTLSIPGLSWLDVHDGAEVAADLPLPALETLLGRGRLAVAPCPLSRRLAAPFGIDRLPLARAAAQLDGLASPGLWLLADPVTWRIDRDRALLADAGVMAISQTEADALIDALNRHFAADGLAFHAPAPARWYLSLSAPVEAAFHSLPDVVGENVDDFLPSGADGLRLSRLLNEAQMLLFTHPVNEAREARGEPRINSLWLWGDGELPALSKPAALYSDQPLHGMLARLSGGETRAAPWSFAALAAEGLPPHAWVELDRLLGAAQYRDAWGWREALQTLEQDWFQPLLQALRQGTLSSLSLLSCGERAIEARVERRDLWKFWRRAKTLTSLY